MKRSFLNALAISMLLVPWALIAQAPAGAPSGATGKCKDGTYTTAPKKSGACRGHKGIDTWFASTTSPANSTASPTPAAPAASSAPAAPAAEPPQTPRSSSTSAASSRSSTTAKVAAPGGRPDLVWVNTSSNVYHCYGSRYYGTTKAGKYMTEADAKGAGARPEHGKPCSK